MDKQTVGFPRLIYYDPANEPLRLDNDGARVASLTQVGTRMKGVELLKAICVSDLRGELIAYEPSTNLPFSLQRVFTIRAGNGTSRGGHANSCHELIVCLAGSVTVDLDNGEETKSVTLRPASDHLWIGPGILIKLREFASETLLLVFASAVYEETRHYYEPRPELLAADCLV